MKKVLHCLAVILRILIGFFSITFIVYIFNLDMKLTAALEPYIQQIQEKMERDRHL